MADMDEDVTLPRVSLNWDRINSRIKSANAVVDDWVNVQSDFINNLDDKAQDKEILKKELIQVTSQVADSIGSLADNLMAQKSALASALTPSDPQAPPQPKPDPSPQAVEALNEKEGTLLNVAN